MECDLVMVEGSLFIALKCRAGAVLMHPRKCPIPLQAKFPEATQEETRPCTLDCEDFPNVTLVKYRGHLALQIQRGTRFFVSAMPKAEYPHLLKRLLMDHLHAQGITLRHILRTDLSFINSLFGLLPCTSPQFSELFSGWGIEIGAPLKLKMDLCFNSVYLAPMVESPRNLKKVELDVCVMQGPMLGEGTFGKVFEISFPSDLTHTLACKRLVKFSKEDTGSFFKNILGEICGLHLCSTVDVHIVNPHTIHLIMPMHGRMNFEHVMTQRRMDRGHSLTPLFLVEEHLGIFRGISTVLQKLHSRGMAHLDIKMCNLIGPGHHYVTRLIDFGLSSQLEGPQKDVVKITVDTRDPEIFAGRECFTWSDVWSMGVIFSDLVYEKRFSVIPYHKPGTWDNGKAYDWKKQENELCSKFIHERINDTESLDVFLQGLYGTIPSMSLGMAYILSGSLWKHPGRRSSFGFLHRIAPVSVSKWPFPVFKNKPRMYAPSLSAKQLILEKQRGHYSLDGSGPYKSIHDIPDLRTLRHKVSEKRRFQLQFITAVLIDLKLFSLKTFLLAVDVLDRVSSPEIVSHICVAYPLHSLFALECVCIYLAVVQSCPCEPQFEQVIEKSLDNLPIHHPRHPPVLWNLFLDLLSTIKFKHSWDDSLWNLVVSSSKFTVPGIGKALMESLLHWPDGKFHTIQFLDGIKPRTFYPSFYSSGIPLPRISLSWITPEFQHIISSSPFFDVHLTSQLPGFTNIEKKIESRTLQSYLEGFSMTHPFYIPLISGLGRSELDAEVNKYCARYSVPENVLDGSNCLVCHKVSSAVCIGCQQWSVCSECAIAFKGRCSQCIYPEEEEQWQRLRKK